ncbi:MAG: TIGR04282 family arsenosugar biosynthesis glycosyltransferase [Promethearchaeati archaeon]
MGEKALIILIKNPRKGEVKTRLAKKIGDEKALEVYLELLKHVKEITVNLDCNKYVFYSSYINEHDEWNSHNYDKFLQTGIDLGERMKNAFKETLEKNDKALLIVSDCYELNSEIINTAFEKLEEYDVVIGPDVDGGYYAIGMKEYHPELFDNKKWSTETVCSDTLEDSKKLGLNYYTLKKLSDIDNYEDLKKSSLFKIIQA